MAILQEYHRPATVDEALSLLSKGKGRLLLLAGGTQLVGRLETRALTGIDGVVDLRSAGLDTIREESAMVHVGAMCTLSAVIAHPALSSLADGLLVRAARGEGPLNLRNAATVGGVVACAEHDSEFYAALLALDATVTVRALDGAEQILPLAGLDVAGRLVTEVSLPISPLQGASARLARTPSDRPIVAAFAVREPNAQNGSETRIALCGVAPRPVLQGTPLDPPDDFKGSAAYRLAMAPVVAQRATAQLGETDTNAD
jgi:CO/xanthine dehydrogenase FAD-binding subunit